MPLDGADVTPDQPLAAAVAELVARERIRELVVSYSILGDRGRIEEMAELFEEGAVLDAVDQLHHGREAIGGFLRGIVEDRAAGADRTFVRHHLANVSVTIDNPNEASGVAYWSVYSDHGFESSGRYRDSYRRGEDGQWRFTARKISRDSPRVAP